MEQQTNPAERQAMSEQVYQLSTLIDKLTKISNSISLKLFSLFVSGKSSLYKEYHEIIVWENRPIPKERLQEFLNLYCQDLIAQRLTLQMALDAPMITAQNGLFVDTKKQNP